MCSISHEYKAIYIQIPKTGGSYVHSLLRDCYNFNTYRFTREDHKAYVGEDADKDDEKGCGKIYGFVNTRKTGILQYFTTSQELYDQAKITKEQWDSYTKFTFIRNPYDKIVSAWKFIDKVKPNHRSLLAFLEFKDECDNSVYSHSFIPQYVHLLDENGELRIDYFGRFECLNEDLIYILKTIGITKITHQKLIVEDIKFNQSSRSNYALHYSPLILQIVNRYFQVDFDKFRYMKCATLEELIADSQYYYFDKEEFNKRNSLLMQQLENDNILETIKNVALEAKIKSIKNNTNNRAALRKLMELTSEQTSNDKEFHANNFLSLLGKFAEKMKENVGEQKVVAPDNCL